jgi:hypothetical protein
MKELNSSDSFLKNNLFEYLKNFHAQNINLRSVYIKNGASFHKKQGYCPI